MNIIYDSKLAHGENNFATDYAIYEDFVFIRFPFNGTYHATIGFRSIPVHICLPTINHNRWDVIERLPNTETQIYVASHDSRREAFEDGFTKCKEFLKRNP